MAQLLIDGGADVKALSRQGGTPLHEAAASASADMVRLILAHGVDPNLADKAGRSALDVAIAFKNQAAAMILRKISE
jgi:ankyrin repeat protein